MKKTLATLLSAMALAVPAAQASIVNIQFTATVNEMRVRDQQPDGSTASSQIWSAMVNNDVINWGEKLTGMLSYDSDTPWQGEGMLGDPNSAYYFGNSLRLQFEGGHVFQSLSNDGPSISIFNNAAYTNGYDMWNVVSYNTSAAEQVILGMYDTSGDMFTDTSLALPSFEHPNSAGLSFNFYNTETHQQFAVLAVLDSIQQVPEPATLATMTVGLGLLAATRRRKKSSNQ